MMKMLMEPDPEWAVLKKECKLGSAVRVKFSSCEETGLPEKLHDPKYIMHVWDNGVCKGAVTEDDLQRDEHGNVVHCGVDIHWSIAERIYERPREEMHKDRERAAGKVINFSCLDRETIILTEEGPARIDQLSPDVRVWDGTAWVHTHGSEPKGFRGVVEYGGVRATPEHVVYTECGLRLPLVDAAAQGLKLADAKDPARPEGMTWTGDIDSALALRVCHLRHEYMKADARFRQRTQGSELTLAATAQEKPQEYEGLAWSDNLTFMGVLSVWDVLDAGPHHRFSADGRLVSNSAYGASPASLERKIKSDTGVAPPPGTGQKGLDAIAMRQPRATEFLEEMSKLPETQGYYRCKSGRIRHAVVHGRDSGVSWRVRQSQLSAMGREFKNVAMQESVGATTARAFHWITKAYERFGMETVPIITLYDSIVSSGPIEERFAARRVHDIYMSEVNTWDYDGRTLRYGVDNEFNYCWSTKPTKKQKEELDDPEWNPTPGRLRFVENLPSLVS